jgi:beta-phosphoglucomutase-like phosphatase (HAD superfamily)
MQLVMFDIDGTLTESNRVDDECFVQALSDVFGFTEIETDWSTYPHCTDSGILATIFERRLGRGPAWAEIANMHDRFLELLTAAVAVRPLPEIAGAGAFVGELLGDSRRTAALASGAWERSARLKLAAARLDCDGLPGAFAEDGPSRDSIMQTSYQRAAMTAGCSAFESVVYIGDGVWDVRAATTLGWPCLGVAADPVRAERLRAAGAVAVFPDFRNFALWMKALDLR